MFDTLMPVCPVEQLLDKSDGQAQVFLALVWDGGRCVGAALFVAPGESVTAQLLLIGCEASARRHGIGRALVRLVRHACCRLARNSGCLMCGAVNVMASRRLRSMADIFRFTSSVFRATRRCF